MNIDINKDYAITSDALNIIVKKRHLTDPKKSPNWSQMKADGHPGTIREDWKEVSYHTTVENALKWTVNQRIRESEVADMNELLAEIQQFHREIKAILSAEGK